MQYGSLMERWQLSSHMGARLSAYTSQIRILEHAYRPLLPSFSVDMYLAIVQARTIPAYDYRYSDGSKRSQCV